MAVSGCSSIFIHLFQFSSVIIRFNHLISYFESIGHGCCVTGWNHKWGHVSRQIPSVKHSTQNWRGDEECEEESPLLSLFPLNNHHHTRLNAKTNMRAQTNIVFVLDKYFNSNRTPQRSVPFTWNQPWVKIQEEVYSGPVMAHHNIS